MAAPLPIAGWYPDSESPGQDRWWDGAGWTDQRRPTASVLPPAAPAAPAVPAAPAGLSTPAYILGEVPMGQPPTTTYIVAPVQRNGIALAGFILSVSGVILPFFLNSLAGGILSAVGLQRSKRLPGNGVLSNGRGLSIAGILIGFIWGGLSLLFWVAFIVFYVWVFTSQAVFSSSGSPLG